MVKHRLLTESKSLFYRQEMGNANLKFMALRCFLWVIIMSLMKICMGGKGFKVQGVGKKRRRGERPL